MESDYGMEMSKRMSKRAVVNRRVNDSKRDEISICNFNELSVYSSVNGAFIPCRLPFTLPLGSKQ